MPSSFSVSPSFVPVDVGGGGAIFLSEEQHRFTQGRIYGDLLPLLRQPADASTLTQALTGRHAPAAVLYAISRLREAGIVCDIDTRAPRGEQAMWSLLGALPGGAGPSVRLLALGVEPGPTSEAFARGGMSVTTCAEVDSAFETREELLVVLTDTYLRPALTAIGATAFAQRRPWLLAKPIGATLWIGPTFRPDGPCWQCLEARLRGNHEVELTVRELVHATEPFVTSVAQTPTSLAIAASLVAFAAERAVRVGPSSADELTTIDLRTMETRRHVLVRRPQCALCGDPRPREAAPLVLDGRAPVRSTDGGIRQATPEATLSSLDRHVSPITGLVKHIEDISIGSSVHVALSPHNCGVPRARSVQELRDRLDSTSAGKGRTRIQARASALCEAIERYSGMFDGTEPRARSTFADREGAIEPTAFALYSDAQYATRRERNETAPTFLWIPKRLDAGTPIDWTPVVALASGRTRWIPSAYAFYSHPTDSAYGNADSNGCAAGNGLEEAIVQGFLELVERDCLAIWWYGRETRPSVDVASFEDDYLTALVREYTELGRTLYALDLTNDLGVPTFVAVSAIAKTGGRVHLGLGSHFDASIALARAFSEINQMLPFNETPFVRSNKMGTDTLMKRWLGRETVHAHPYLLPSGAPPRAVGDYERPVHGSASDALRSCMSVAERASVEIYVLDQTRPDVDVPVVRVLAPGLRHHWCRFAPGRLYDVPVALGWRSRPLREEELNPMPMFL